MKRIQITFLFLFLTILCGNTSFSQINPLKKVVLQKILKEVVKDYDATVGLGMIHIESGDTLVLRNDLQFPMQSVYKFPLALAVMNEVDKGNLKLDQVYRVTKEDLLDETWSPLKKKFPEGDVDLTISELLNYSVSQSDNIACDILFKLMKGTKPVNDYIHGIGIPGMQIVATEHEMRADWKIQYTNWSKPMDMAHLLEGFYRKTYLSDSSNVFLMDLMIESANDPERIKALLPKRTVVAHKTGTSNERDGIYDACNDVGIITLPDKTHLALAIFVSNSKEDYDKTRKLIAQLTKLIYDLYTEK